MSESEEMYLITIAKLVEDGRERPIPLSMLAEALSVAPVSVNQMVKKLAEAGLVAYLPYKGVDLTAQGRQVAIKVLRHRRLWEVFLVEHLHLPLPEADALACRLEHITSPEVGDRLSRFLDDPTVSPQGKSIPKTDGSSIPEPSSPLSEQLPGSQSEVLEVRVEPTTSAYLQAGVCLRVPS